MKCLPMALAALGFSTLVLAQDRREIPGEGQMAPAEAAASEFQRLVVPGRTVSSGVRKLRKQLEWHKTLRAAARKARRLDKPILWIQALGTLRGYT